MSQTAGTLAIALVRRAARTAPGALSARLEEEWLADMRERTSSLSRLRFAVGCCWASIAIGLEHRPFSIAAAGGAQGNASLIVAPPRFFSARALTFGLVLSLHAAVFCGLMMARANYSKSPEPPALEPHVIDQPAPLIKPPPPHIADIRIDPRAAPPPLPPIEPTVETKLPNIVSEPNRLPLQPPGGDATPPPREVVRVPGGPGPAFPHPDDYYPDASRRLEEQGAAVLRVCVGAAGQLSSAPERLESSGSARLDAAALKLAKAGSGHYRPSTEDGRPVASCYPMKIRFQLRN
jgi:TonB family protein